MGNDGGSIPTRRDLVKDSRKEPSSAQVFENKQMSHNDVWTTCYLTGEKLVDPIVGDYRGNLYNKEAVLRYLLDQDSRGFSEAQRRMVKHIKSLKDVVDIKRTFDENSGSWICPVTQKDVVGESIASSFCYIVPCGHVFLQASLKEIQDNQCAVCDVEFDPRDMITINPDQQQAERLEKRMDVLKDLGLRHSLKHKKHKKPQSESESKSKSKSKSLAENAETKAARHEEQEHEPLARTAKRGHPTGETTSIKRAKNISISLA